MNVAFRAVQIGGILPHRAAAGIGIIRRQNMHIDAALTDFECGFQSFDHAAAFGIVHAQPVLNHFKTGVVLAEEARVTLCAEQRLDFIGLEILRHWHRKRKRQPRIAGSLRPRRQGIEDGLRRIPRHLRAAALAIQMRRARKQQLQVIVELGHRAHGRARGAHRIDLIDGDRRRNAFYGIDLRPVLAVKELPRVRRKGFDVTALAFGVECVEHQRRFAATRNAGDHHQFVQRYFQRKILQVVLAGAADDDAFAFVFGNIHACNR